MKQLAVMTSGIGALEQNCSAAAAWLGWTAPADAWAVRPLHERTDRVRCCRLRHLAERRTKNANTAINKTLSRFRLPGAVASLKAVYQ
jgi:hypothetical protein